MPVKMLNGPRPTYISSSKQDMEDFIIALIEVCEMEGNRCVATYTQELEFVLPDRATIVEKEAAFSDALDAEMSTWQ